MNRLLPPFVSPSFCLAMMEEYYREEIARGELSEIPEEDLPSRERESEKKREISTCDIRCNEQFHSHIWRRGTPNHLN